MTGRADLPEQEYSNEAMRKTVLRVALSGLWALAVCYPDSRVRYWQAVHEIHERVQYAVPWQTLGVPWAIPTPGQTMATGLGDCQARAMVFASVLASKKIPFQLRASLDHMWVEFSGKRPNVLENDSKTLWTRPPPDAGMGIIVPNGSISRAAQAVGVPTMIQFRLPSVDWAESWRIEREYFWDAAPLSRKSLLAVGMALIWMVRR